MVTLDSEVIQENESYKARIAFEAQKSRKIKKVKGLWRYGGI
jgi:hypothetical protein